MKTTQKQQAKNLFFGTTKSRKEIADELTIDEKTLYLWIKKEAWDENKKAALAAPAIIVDNLCYMLVELQNYISERPIGSRFPTAQEADTMRKLINSITKMKEYTSVGSNMQMMVDFTNYIGADQQFCDQLQTYAESYFTARKANTRYNNNFGFAAEPSPSATEAELNEIKENILADINDTNDLETGYPTVLTQPTPTSTSTQTEILKMPGLNFTTKSEILFPETPETLINRAFSVADVPCSFRLSPEKTGNFSGTIKRPAFLNRCKIKNINPILKSHTPPIAA
jgi:hypothetical protein